MFLLIFVSFLKFSDSFVLDDKTQQPPTVGSFLTDSHYNTLMDMIYQERQSRLHLEKYVTHLHKRLSDGEIQSKALQSKVEILERKQGSCELIEKVQNTTDILASNYTSLLTDYNKLKLEFTNVSRRTNHLETDLNVLKNIKSVSQLQYIHNITLNVINVGKKLQETNNKVNVLMSDDMARKQDFLALLADNNKAKQTIASSTVQVENKFKVINRKLNESSKSYDELKMKMQHEFGILQTKHTNISVTLQQNVQKLSEKSKYKLLQTNVGVPSLPICVSVSKNPAHGEVYSIQHYVIKFVSDMRQVGGFLWVLLFPPTIILATTIKL